MNKLLGTIVGAMIFVASPIAFAQQTYQYVGVADTTELGCAGPRTASTIGCLNNPPPGGAYNDALIVVHGGLDLNTCLAKVQNAQNLSNFNPKMGKLDAAHVGLFAPPTSPGLSSYNGSCDVRGDITYVGWPRQGGWTIIFQALTWDQCTLLLAWSTSASCGTRSVD